MFATIPANTDIRKANTMSNINIRPPFSVARLGSADKYIII